jgi:chromosome segregation ATPase
MSPSLLLTVTSFSPRAAHRLKLVRQESPNPAQEDLKKTVNEQAAMIDTLKSEKSDLESTVDALKTDHDRVLKENQILRRAVNFQQERFTNSENELKTTKSQRAECDERIRCLEQMILSLRYHLQAQETHRGNDFMHHRPPDVF